METDPRLTCLRIRIAAAKLPRTLSKKPRRISRGRQIALLPFAVVVLVTMATMTVGLEKLIALSIEGNERIVRFIAASGPMSISANGLPNFYGPAWHFDLSAWKLPKCALGNTLLDLRSCEEKPSH